MSKQKKKLYNKIIQIGKILSQKGLIVATDGNISTRLNKYIVLITPAGFDKGNLKQSDILRIGLVGKLIKPKEKFNPSSEAKMHIAIYQTRTEINAVIHAHPVYATALASTKNDIKIKALNWIKKLPEIEQTIGEISVLSNLPPGSGKLAQAVGEAIKKSNVVLLSKHGIVAGGKDLDQALYRIERIELATKLYFISELFNRFFG